MQRVLFTKWHGLANQGMNAERFAAACPAFAACAAQWSGLKVESMDFPPAIILNERFALVWSHVFEAPELYLSLEGQLADGQARVTRKYGVENVLRVAEHPLTGSPALCVNACGARAAITERMSCMQTPESPLSESLAWLAAFISLYGPAVGLHIPLDMHMELCGMSPAPPTLT